ncbi:FAD-binding protein [Aciditerrimonas ferrireducens]|uniref:FAD-binding protein n=1 Tax=Aciditerrimonas ferrireducens TaxID=667306 RepID=UPI00249E66F4|nr:FAD-binding protein [Aciditerrimonas ferrireducens]
MRVAVLLKQVPAAEALSLGPDGRLVRQGVALEVNPFCRRAVAQAVALARRSGGTCVAMSLGPPSAEAALREALACGADEAVLLSDPSLAGSDTLATSAALVAALDRLGPFDLVLVGKSAVDADTGQVGPQVAERLGWPFVPAARALRLEPPSGLGPARLWARCELDDGWQEVRVALPAVLAAAERLIDPCKPDAAALAEVGPGRVRVLGPAALGPGPFGAEGSRTLVRRVRQALRPARARQVFPLARLEEAVEAVRARLAETGGAGAAKRPGPGEPMSDPGVAPIGGRRGEAKEVPTVAVLAEPGRPAAVAGLLNQAAALASALGAELALAGPAPADSEQPEPVGANRLLVVEGRCDPAGVAAALGAHWCGPGGPAPAVILALATQWGREAAARLAVRLGAGLTGDAVALTLDGDRLVCWKPEPAGTAMAEVVALGPIQMATVRPGVGETSAHGPGAGGSGVPVVELVPPADRVPTPVEVLGGGRDDDVAALLRARRVCCVGLGVDPEDYPLVRRLAARIGAELAGTRKVTDRGWLPRARQVGVTGHSVAPELYLAVGLSGRTNHAVGALRAGTVLALNADPAAPVFEWADVGIVGDWRQALPRLADVLAETPSGRSGSSAASISERGTPSK